MDLTITQLSPETISALETLAQQNGATLEEYARSILEREAQKRIWLKNFNEWMNSPNPNTPGLTDEQISRESIYEEQTLRQL